MQRITAAICIKCDVDKCSAQTSQYAQTRMSAGPPNHRILKHLLGFLDRIPLFPQKAVFSFFCEVFFSKFSKIKETNTTISWIEWF